MRATRGTSRPLSQSTAGQTESTLPFAMEGTCWVQLRGQIWLLDMLLWPTDTNPERQDSASLLSSRVPERGLCIFLECRPTCKFLERRPFPNSGTIRSRPPKSGRIRGLDLGPTLRADLGPTSAELRRNLHRSLGPTLGRTRPELGRIWADLANFDQIQDRPDVA